MYDVLVEHLLFGRSSIAYAYDYEWWQRQRRRHQGKRPGQIKADTHSEIHSLLARAPGEHWVFTARTQGPLILCQHAGGGYRSYRVFIII